MGEVRMEQDRKKEVIENCLNLFIAKGLSETSTRDLSGSLKLQNAGLYYYFNSRSEAVIACVEAAVLRMESKMILAALKDVDDPDRMIKNLYRHADEMAPTMRFIVQAYASPTYRSSLNESLRKLEERNQNTVVRFAKKFKCSPSEIEPYVYMCITAMTNYMVFGSESYVTSQINIVRNKVNELLTRNCGRKEN